MLDAIFWGIIQGLTEFLPISSSGHLVLIPAIFGRPAPDLATNAMLHLGTLLAVLVYFRRDLARMARLDRPARRLITVIVIGTIPAVVLGLAFEDRIEELVSDPFAVSMMLIVTGVILLSTTLIRIGDRITEDVRPLDGLLVGLAQSFALIPGISRSGMTISAGLTRGLGRTEAARFAFLLGIPVIAGAGLLQMAEVVSSGEAIGTEVWAGMAAAAISGYAAIAILLRFLSRVGLAPFGIYCVAFGVFSAIVI
ncbi:MAG TPA: undecaprenyl-diphosphate phosphatase [Acidimicrobiia bacterium]|nr:undecaprenyl-diphosphate phosphatase [Acidimicrobiia bacterium]